MKLFLSAALLIAGSAFAQDTVTRTDATDNKVVIMVGECSISRKIDFNNQEVYESTLPVTNCQEYKTYQAKVSGKSWNQKYTPVSGTESYSYKLEDATQINTGGSTADVMEMMRITAACNEKKQLLRELAKAQSGQAKCKL
jgi:hypothetical protein